MPWLCSLISKGTSWPDSAVRSRMWAWGVPQDRESWNSIRTSLPRFPARNVSDVGECVKWCQGHAISIEGKGKDRKSVIDPERCVGCAECIVSCPHGAIRIQWNESVPIFMEKMVEYAGRHTEDKGR